MSPENWQWSLRSFSGPLSCWMKSFGTMLRALLLWCILWLFSSSSFPPTCFRTPCNLYTASQAFGRRLWEPFMLLEDDWVWILAFLKQDLLTKMGLGKKWLLFPSYRATLEWKCRQNVSSNTWFYRACVWLPMVLLIRHHKDVFTKT